ncbi:MAG: hypothetical protein ABSF26_22680 [Thermoguttaceae bacterium]|jgi:hypothetical protein
MTEQETLESLRGRTASHIANPHEGRDSESFWNVEAARDRILAAESFDDLEKDMDYIRGDYQAAVINRCLPEEL